MSQSEYQTNYEKYKHHLAEFSLCMKPVLDASYEKLILFKNVNEKELNQYCVDRRELVEKYRNLLKSSQNQI